ncbi:MAG: hypothetical protein KDM63_17355, partial [Verrucomicrobiae bacterium]|nr:hypothetical protein [Verrucomicrobiae bacterium]
MKPVLWILALALAPLASCSTSEYAGSMPGPPAMAEFQPGDIVMRSGDRLLADRSYYNRRDHRFTHAGLVVGGSRVVHVHPTEGGGVAHVTPLKRFVSDSGTWAVFRPDLPEPERASAARSAEQFARERRPFDRGLDLETRDSLYCTELIWRAYLDATGVDLVPKKPTTLTVPFVTLDSLYFG